MRSAVRESLTVTAVSIPVALITVSAPFLSAVFLIILLSWLVSRLGLHYYLVALTALLLPFSIETQLNRDTYMFIPTEPLIMTALLTLFWDILYDPFMLKRLLRIESRWILPLLAWCIIAVLFSTMKTVSLKFTLVNISYIAVFFLYYKLLISRGDINFENLIALYSLSLASVFMYSIWQYSGYDFNPVTVRGIYLPFYKDHTIFGAAAAMISVYWLVKGLHESPNTRKILYLLAGLFFLAAVIISSSRAAILSISIFVVVYILIAYRVRFWKVAVILAISALILFIMRERLRETISGDVSGMERLNRWSAGLGMAAEKPVTGFGPGTYQFKYISYQKPEFRNRLTVDNPWHIPENSGVTAHSEYILILSEMGYTGLILFLIFAGRLLYVIFERGRNLRNRTSVWIGACALSTYLFHAFFNNYLNSDKIAFLFWGFSALILSSVEGKSLTETTLPGPSHSDRIFRDKTLSSK